jgi:hypothetical protein
MIWLLVRSCFIYYNGLAVGVIVGVTVFVGVTVGVTVVVGVTVGVTVFVGVTVGVTLTHGSTELIPVITHPLSSIIFNI